LLKKFVIPVFFDKELLSMDGSIGELFLACQGIFCMAANKECRLKERMPAKIPGRYLSGSKK
jgi:hypothetical protein